MSRDDFLQAIYDKSFEAGMNQQYFQTVTTEWSDYDTKVKIAVAIIAIIGLLATIFEKPLIKQIKGWKEAFWASQTFSLRLVGWTLHVVWLFVTSLFWAIASVVIATILLVSPTDVNVKLNSDLYRGWTDVRADLDALDLLAAADDGSAVSQCLIDRLKDTLTRISRLEAMEPTPDQELVAKCHGDESERRWGKGVRTFQQRKSSSEKASASVPNASLLR